jgi:uncharacterized protein (DUF302 family)
MKNHTNSIKDLPLNEEPSAYYLQDEINQSYDDILAELENELESQYMVDGQ